MAQSYIVPKIGTKGKFEFKPPFNKVETLRTQYTVQAIRSLKELKDSDEQPYEQIYVSNGITEEEFKDDLNNNVPILCLIGNGDEYLYVPANRVKKLPDISGVKYQEMILAISLGQIPYGSDLSVTKDTIVNNVYDTFGVTSTIEEVRGSAITMVEDIDHENYMKLLKNKRKESLSYKSKYEKLITSYNKLREHLDCLTEYIQNNCCGSVPTAPSPNTPPIYSQIVVPDYNYMDTNRIVVHGSAEEFPDTGYASQLAQYGLRIAMDPKYNPDPDNMCPCLVVVKGILETLPMIINYRTNEIEFGAGGSNNRWDVMLYGYWFRTVDGWKPFAVGQLLTSFKNVVTRFNEYYKIPFISGLAIVETNPPIDHYMSNTGNPFNNINRLPFGANSYTGRTNNATVLNNVNSDHFTKYLVERHDTLGWTIYGNTPSNETLATNSLFYSSWKDDVLKGDTCLLGGSAGRSNSEELAILYTNKKEVCDYGSNQIPGDYPRYIRMKPLPNLQYDVDNRVCTMPYPPISFKDMNEWRFNGTTEDDWLNNKIIIFHESLHGQTADYTTLKNNGKLDGNDKLARPYNSGSLIDGTSVNIRIPRSMGDHNLIQSPVTVRGWNCVECGPIDIPMDSFWFPRYVRAFRAGTTVSTSNLTRVAAPIYTTYEEFVNAGNVDKYYDTDRPGYVSVNGANWIFKWLPVYDIPLSKCRLVKDGTYKGIDVKAVLREYETSVNNRSMNTTYPPNVDLEVWIPNFDESQYIPYEKPVGKGSYAWVYFKVEGSAFNTNDTRLMINKDKVRFEEHYNGSCSGSILDTNYNKLGKNIDTSLNMVLHSNILKSKDHKALFDSIKGKPIADILIGTEMVDKPTVTRLCPWYGDDDMTTAFLDTVPDEYWNVTRTSSKAYMPDFLAQYTSQANVDKLMSSIITINNETELKLNAIDHGTITTSVGNSPAPLHLIAWRLDPNDVTDPIEPDQPETPPSSGSLNIGLNMYMAGKTLSDFDVPWNDDKNCYYIDSGEYSFGVDTKAINVNGKEYSISVDSHTGILRNVLNITENGATLHFSNSVNAGIGIWSYTKTKKESTTFLIKWTNGSGKEQSLTIKDKNLVPPVVDETLTDKNEIRKLIGTIFPLTVEAEFETSAAFLSPTNPYHALLSIMNPVTDNKPSINMNFGLLIDNTTPLFNSVNDISRYFSDIKLGINTMTCHRLTMTPNNREFKILQTGFEFDLFEMVRTHPKLAKAHFDYSDYDIVGVTLNATVLKSEALWRLDNKSTPISISQSTTVRKWPKISKTDIYHKYPPYSSLIDQKFQLTQSQVENYTEYVTSTIRFQITALGF